MITTLAAPDGTPMSGGWGRRPPPPTTWNDALPNDRKSKAAALNPSNRELYLWQTRFKF